jgi:DsbC/DsbD-like thiol-disulfide interchange protein
LIKVPLNTPLIASPDRKGQLKLTSAAKFAMILIAMLGWVTSIPAAATETRASVTLEGATISVQAAPAMAQALLADVISLDEGEHVLFISIDLNSGWKTYWRQPGRFGLAPDFDWQASENVASVRVHFPEPLLFEEGNGTSIGYQAPTLWPVVVRSKNADRPVDIHLALNVGLCAELCIPERVELSASVSDLTAQPDVTMAQIFALESNLAANNRQLNDLILEHHGTEISIITDTQNGQGSFAIAEDEQGRHVLLQTSDDRFHGASALSGEWRWETPISRVTVVEPGNRMEVFSNSPQGQR